MTGEEVAVKIQSEEENEKRGCQYKKAGCRGA